MSLSQSRRICRNCPIALTLTALLAVSAIAQDRQVNGNSLLAEVAKEIRLTNTVVSAKMDVNVHAFGQTIYGEGTYTQCPFNGELLIRTDLKVKLVSQRESRYQLNRNENELIIQHNVNDAREFVGRVSLRRLREAGVLKNANLAVAGVPGATASPALAPVDGIASTLEALSTHFQFGKVQSKEVEGASYSAARGSWKLASRAFGQGDDGKFRESMPDAVEVVIETPADKGRPRFPYSITYLKRVTKGGVASYDPMLVLQYRNVEALELSSVNINNYTVKIDSHMKVVDITDQYLVPPPQ